MSERRIINKKATTLSERFAQINQSTNAGTRISERRIQLAQNSGISGRFKAVQTRRNIEVPERRVGTNGVGVVRQGVQTRRGTLTSPRGLSRGGPKFQGTRLDRPRGGLAKARGGFVVRGGTRGGRGAGTRGGRGGKGNKGKGPVSKEDLDKELDAFMMQDASYAKNKLDEDLDEYFKGAKKDDSPSSDATKDASKD